MNLLYVKALESYRLTVIHTYRQTDRQTDKTEIIYHAASRVVIVTPLFRFGVDLMYTAGWCDQALF